MKTSLQYRVYSSIWTVLALSACLNGTSTDTFAQQPPVDESVINKWKEYEQFSRSLQGMKQETGSLVSKTYSQTLSFKQNRECVIIRHLLGGKPPETITLANPRYFAELERDTSDPQKTVLVRHEQDLGAILRFWQRPLSDTAFLETSPHFSYHGTRLSDLVSKPSFRVKKLSKEDHDGKDLVRIDHSYVYEEPHKRFQIQGSIYLDPSRCWCIRQVKNTEVIFHDGVRHRTMDWDIWYETSDHSTGFPLVKSYTMKLDGYYERDKRKTGGTIQGEYEWEVDDSLPNAEFTLSAFGLPEPVGVTWEKPVPTYVWVLAAAGACAALAFGFRRLARWHQVAAPRQGVK